MIGLLALAIASLVCFRLFRESTSAPPSPSVDDFRVPGKPGEPNIIVTPDHRVSRVQHKDAQGVSPLEEVYTKDGIIRVQRTFSATGKLLKEEAFLNGKSVPVPRKVP
jgi:hypothetical protein